MIAVALIYAATGITLAVHMHRLDAFSASDSSLSAAAADVVAFAVIAAGWLPILLYVCACRAIGRPA